MEVRFLFCIDSEFSNPCTPSTMVVVVCLWKVRAEGQISVSNRLPLTFALQYSVLCGVPLMENLLPFGLKEL